LARKEGNLHSQKNKPDMVRHVQGTGLKGERRITKGTTNAPGQEKTSIGKTGRIYEQKGGCPKPEMGGGGSEEIIGDLGGTMVLRGREHNLQKPKKTGGGKCKWHKQSSWGHHEGQRWGRTTDHNRTKFGSGGNLKKGTINGVPKRVAQVKQGCKSA